MGLSGPRQPDPAAQLFRTNRDALYGPTEDKIWRQHVLTENAAEANLLANRFVSSPSEMSFLASSTKDMGSWASTANRRSRFELAIQRLDSHGALPGPLQMSASTGSLALIGFDDNSTANELPTDFLPSPTRGGKRTPFGESSRSLSLRSLDGTRPQTGQSEALSITGSSLSGSLRSSGSLVRSAALQSAGSWGSHWDDGHQPTLSRPATASNFGGHAVPCYPGLDERRSKPRPLISGQAGLYGHSSNRQQNWLQKTVAGRRR